jgi:hypothetical protein
MMHGFAGFLQRQGRVDVVRDRGGSFLWRYWVRSGRVLVEADRHWLRGPAAVGGAFFWHELAAQRKQNHARRRGCGG